MPGPLFLKLELGGGGGGTLSETKNGKIENKDPVKNLRDYGTANIGRIWEELIGEKVGRVVRDDGDWGGFGKLRRGGNGRNELRMAG